MTLGAAEIGPSEGRGADWHVSSLVVYVRPAALQSVTQTIASLSGVEVSAAEPTGKLVVLVTGESEEAVAERLRAINAVDGVFAASLVFQAID